MQFTFNIFSVQPVSNDIFEKASAQYNCTTTIFSTTEKSGTFKFHFEVNIKSDHDFSFRDRVNFTNAVAQLCTTEILIDEGGIDPYLFIYFKPGEEPTTIGVDTQRYNDFDELLIDSYYSLGWGMFATEQPLSVDEEQWISKWYAKHNLKMNLVLVDPDLVNRHFREAQKSATDLEKFSHFFLLSPPAKCIWHSRDEKSLIAENCLFEFHLNSKKSVCLFPVNHSTVANIPGGSDSEEFCFVFRGENKEKIVYKQRRKSWR